MIYRILTGLVLIGIGLFTIIYGRLPLLTWLITCSVLMALEMTKILSLSRYVMLGIAVGFSILFFGAVYSPEYQTLWTLTPTMTFTGFLLLFFLYELYSKRLFFIARIRYCILRIGLIAGFLFSFIFILRTHFGMVLTLFCFISIWVSDICALYGGKWFGRRQLSSISPKKTVEGLLCSILGTVIISGFYIHYFQLPWIPFIVIAAFIPIIGQLGDLHESLFKRYFSQKDSSHLLPGHGGIYDRADSSLFVVPIYYYLLLILYST